MQFESEQRLSRSVGNAVRTQKEALQIIAALRLLQARGLRQQTSSKVQGLWFGAAGFPAFICQTQCQLDPNGHWMLCHGRKIEGLRHARLNGCGQAGSDGFERFGLWRGALEGFGDDVGDRYLGSEQAAGHLGHLCIALDLCAISRHGGRCPDADQLVRQSLTDSAHQQRHISALASSVGVQFIEHQELQSLGVGNHLLVNGVLPRQQQLQHHEVGEQDVRRVGLHRLPLFSAFLTRKAAESDRTSAWVGTQELFELLQLAVGQGVHWIDHDGASARRLVCLSCLDAVVNDGDEVRQRLPRARAGGEHIALACRS